MRFITSFAVANGQYLSGSSYYPSYITPRAEKDVISVYHGKKLNHIGIMALQPKKSTDQHYVYHNLLAKSDTKLSSKKEDALQKRREKAGRTKNRITEDPLWKYVKKQKAEQKPIKDTLRLGIHNKLQKQAQERQESVSKILGREVSEHHKAHESHHKEKQNKTSNQNIHKQKISKKEHQAKENEMIKTVEKLNSELSELQESVQKLADKRARSKIPDYHFIIRQEKSNRGNDEGEVPDFNRLGHPANDHLEPEIISPKQIQEADEHFLKIQKRDEDLLDNLPSAPVKPDSPKPNLHASQQEFQLDPVAEHQIERLLSKMEMSDSSLDTRRELFASNPEEEEGEPKLPRIAQHLDLSKKKVQNAQKKHVEKKKSIRQHKKEDRAHTEDMVINQVNKALHSLENAEKKRQILKDKIQQKLDLEENAKKIKQEKEHHGHKQKSLYKRATKVAGSMRKLREEGLTLKSAGKVAKSLRGLVPDSMLPSKASVVGAVVGSGAVLAMSHLPAMFTPRYKLSSMHQRNAISKNDNVSLKKTVALVPEAKKEDMEAIVEAPHEHKRHFQNLTFRLEEIADEKCGSCYGKEEADCSSNACPNLNCVFDMKKQVCGDCNDAKSTSLARKDTRAVNFRSKEQCLKHAICPDFNRHWANEQCKVCPGECSALTDLVQCRQCPNCVVAKPAMQCQAGPAAGSHMAQASCSVFSNSISECHSSRACMWYAPDNACQSCPTDAAGCKALSNHICGQCSGTCRLVTGSDGLKTCFAVTPEQGATLSVEVKVTNGKQN